MAIPITEARANVDELNFDGPVLIIGGPYGNLAATEAALAAVEAAGGDGEGRDERARVSPIPRAYRCRKRYRGGRPRSSSVPRRRRLVPE